MHLASNTKTATIAIAIFIFTIAAFLFCYHAFFVYGFTHEFCIYADIGRTIAEKGRFATHILHPANLAVYDTSGIPLTSLMPVIDRFPLYSFLVAASMKIFGPTDFAMAIVGGTTLALFSTITFLAGQGLIGKRNAIMAAIVLALSPTFMKFFALWGYTDFAFSCVVAATLFLFSKIKGMPSKQQLLACGYIGVLCGIGYLARPNMVVIAIVIIIYIMYIFPFRRAALNSSIVIITGLIITSPYLWYLWTNFHSLIPAAFAHNIAQIGGGEARPFLNYTVPDFTVTVSNLTVLIQKWLDISVEHIAQFPIYWQFEFIIPFFVAATFMRQEKTMRRFLQINLISLAATVMAFALVRPEQFGPYVQGRYLLPFAPAVALYGIWGFGQLTEHLPSRSTHAAMRIFILCILAFYSYFYSFVYNNLANEVSNKPALQWPSFQQIAKLVPHDGLIATNLPAQVGWYLKRTSLSLPNSTNTLAEIDKHHRIDAVFLSTLVSGELHNYPGWAPLLANRNLLDEFCHNQGYTIAGVFTDGILLTRIY